MQVLDSVVIVGNFKPHSSLVSMVQAPTADLDTIQVPRTPTVAASVLILRSYLLPDPDSDQLQMASRLCEKESVPSNTPKICLSPSTASANARPWCFCWLHMVAIGLGNRNRTSGIQMKTQNADSLCANPLNIPSKTFKNIRTYPLHLSSPAL